MPLASASASIGPQLAAAAGSVDPVGVLAWASIGAAICSSLPGCITNFDPTKGTVMLVAAGVVLPSSGGFSTNPASAAAFGIVLAASAGSVDGVGISKWVAIGNAIVDWMGSKGCYGSSGLVGYTGPAPPANGPVTGSGQVGFTDENIGPSLAEAAGSTDAAGIAKWTAIGAVIINAIKTNGAIAPATMQNPAVGGPVVGTGLFS